MPADFHLTETRQPPLKDPYDEWLARVIRYAFSAPASAFVTQDAERGQWVPLGATDRQRSLGALR